MPDNISTSSSQTMTMESVFVMMFKGALDRFQETWMGEKGFDHDKYNWQLMYLIHLIPDEDAQKRIWRAYNGKNAEIEKRHDMDDAQKAAAAGMIAVTEIVKFVCNTFDLTHSDIIGPARSKDVASVEDEDDEEEEDIE